MNKRFLIAWLVTFVVWMAGGYVVHGVLLVKDYMQLTSLFRPDADSASYFPLIILAHVFVSGAFTWIYSRGVEATSWIGQGLRFGIAVAFLTVIPTYMIYYAIQPMPQSVVIKQIIFDGIFTVLMGPVVAWFYRDGKRA